VFERERAQRVDRERARARERERERETGRSTGLEEKLDRREAGGAGWARAAKRVSDEKDGSSLERESQSVGRKRELLELGARSTTGGVHGPRFWGRQTRDAEKLTKNRAASWGLAVGTGKALQARWET